MLILEKEPIIAKNVEDTAFGFGYLEQDIAQCVTKILEDNFKR
jgi:hypothetical protein